MASTVTSPPAHHLPPSSRSSSVKSPPVKPPSSAANLSPFFASPRVSTPQNSNLKTAQTPSPNYFGFQAGGDGTSFLNDTPHHVQRHWSPPSSAVRSTAAASPRIVPADHNPDFDAFRRQSEGRAFNLGSLGGDFNMSAPPLKSKHARKESQTSPKMPSSSSRPAKHIPPPRSRQSSSQHIDPGCAEVSRSPKRVLSPGSAQQPESERRGSPPRFADRAQERPQSHPRFQLPLDNLQSPFGLPKVPRAETLPATTNAGPSGGLTEPQMVTPQHVVNLINAKNEDILLLDLRVATQYAKSHISGALNLCIPTTLLKRPSFNVKKLADTFSDHDLRAKFENWRNSRYIIVYDAASVELRDAHSCINVVKKFKTESYEGQLYIIKGGFADFSKLFRNYIVSGENGAHAETDGPEVAPVAGGCPMPATDNAANPFFGNIRQNMDLIGGVGQIPLKHPARVSQSRERNTYPPWLQMAADDRDQGKRVSNSFESIERREKKRMEDALSVRVLFGTPTPQDSNGMRHVQIAGLEKGNKNRYNGIWPFEHSRVKLQGVRSDGCDYFNANFVQAHWSYKRYISTQAPIPATFNDFWNVVWQEDVRVIVMLTAEKEGAQVKAHNYWDQKRYGPLHLDFLSEKRASLEPSRIHKHHSQSKSQKQGRPSPARTKSSSNTKVPLAELDSREDKSATNEQPYVIVRKFTLSHEKYPFEPMREITQLQYSSWPDFGAPAHPAHLLGLVEQTDAVVRATNRNHRAHEPEPPNTRPVLVHCSAGCGRTGTFCTVDSVIDMLKRQRISRTNSSAMEGRQRQPTPMDIDTHSRPGSVKSKAPSGDQKSRAADAEDAAVVRNSDGVNGPKGTWLQRDDLDLVEKTVEDFRHQRLSMVQSLRQYVLCYESVMEWLVEQEESESGLSSDGNGSPR